MLNISKALEYEGIDFSINWEMKNIKEPAKDLHLKRECNDLFYFPPGVYDEVEMPPWLPLMKRPCNKFLDYIENDAIEAELKTHLKEMRGRIRKTRV